MTRLEEMEEPKLVPAIAVRTAYPDGSAMAEARLATPVLGQNEYWWPDGKEAIKLEDMTPGHRANLIVWLEQRAIGLMLQYDIDLLFGPFGPKGDHATDDVLRILEEEASRPAIDRLRETPFYKRLEYLIELDRATGEPF